jgi:hypothetical protein
MPPFKPSGFAIRAVGPHGRSSLVAPTRPVKTRRACISDLGGSGGDGFGGHGGGGGPPGGRSDGGWLWGGAALAAIVLRKCERVWMERKETRERKGSGESMCDELDIPFSGTCAGF